MRFADMKPRLQISRDDALSGDKKDSVRWTGEELWRMLGHDLRTPLNGIEGFLDLLSCTNLDAEQKEFLETAMDSAECLRSILDGILECARVESGQLLVSTQATNVRELIAAVLHQHQRQAKRSGVEIREEISVEVPRLVSLDKGKLRQILVNLVGNALKFTEHGYIVVRAERLQGSLVFSVADTGIGIPQAQLGQVFEAFYQCAPNGEQDMRGIGLGLAIVKKLVETLGGAISISSETGVGTTVSFRIPCLT